MSMVNIHNQPHQLDDNRVSLDAIVAFLTDHLDAIIHEVHHDFDKLLVDDGETQLNCPPPPEPGDNHGALLLRAISEQHDANGIAARRDIRVHDCGIVPTGETTSSQPSLLHTVEIRESRVHAATTAGEPPVATEQTVTVQIQRRSDPKQ